jgi:Flp pilus assembly protein TadG
MLGEKSNHRATRRGFMSSLARDVRGNTLAIMAAALIPLAGLVGGGIDISRMYITKTRLQHACDAGALAGRKAMGGGTWGSDDNTAAEQFFNANFASNSYGSSSLQKSFTENAGKVSGTASAVLPMTLMRIFGQTTQTLSVTCDAEMRLPNTDVMFVLDNSGSMGEKAVSSDADTKIQSLRTSVKCFYEIVARLPTDATCTTAKPSGGTGTQVQIRFGFVNYSTNVNVGKLLPTTYFPDTWTYQTRQANYTPVTTYTFPNQGTAQVTSAGYVNSNTGHYSSYSSVSATSSSDCNSKVPANTSPTLSGSEGSPQNVQTTQSGSTQTSTWYTKQSATYYTYSGSYSSGRHGSNGTCTITRAQVSADYQRNYSRSDAGVPQITQVFSNWTYGALPVNISGLKSGTSWNSSITLPIGTNGADKVVSWSGCIEERHTVPGTNFDPIPSGANDLDIDSLPVVGSDDTLWKPALPGLIYMRRNSSGSYTIDPVTTTSNYSQPGADCPTESRKLQAWTDPSTFDTYVDSLVPTVNTYHDIGLLWGARFLSPTGIFASENALTQPAGGNQGGAEIERHLIFMTDGDTQTNSNDYAAYGIPWYDRRNVTAADVGNSPGTLNMDESDEVNARFAALCTAIKNKNITLWVISFGSGSNSTTENRLSQCATPGRYFTARSSSALQTTFASIANQISQLRLTK